MTRDPNSPARQGGRSYTRKRDDCCVTRVTCKSPVSGSMHAPVIFITACINSSLWQARTCERSRRTAAVYSSSRLQQYFVHGSRSERLNTRYHTCRTYVMRGIYQTRACAPCCRDYCGLGSDEETPRNQPTLITTTSFTLRTTPAVNISNLGGAENIKGTSNAR